MDWELAAATPILDVLSALGLDQPGRDGKVHCVNHEEDTPSLHVYEDENRWYAFCCGVGGSPIDLVATVYGCSKWKAANWLLTSGLEPVAVPDRQARETTVDLTDRVIRESEPLYPEDAGQDKWLRFFQRWPSIDSPKTIGYLFTRYGLRKASNALWIPHRHDQATHGVKVRDLTTGKKMSVQGSRYPYLYRPVKGWQKSDVLVLCEGESDTWCMDAHLATSSWLVNVAGLPSGAGALPATLLAQIAEYERVFLALDDDEAGNRAAEKIVKHTGHGARLNVPGGRVAEALADGWEVDLSA